MNQQLSNQIQLIWLISAASLDYISYSVFETSYKITIQKLCTIGALVRLTRSVPTGASKQSANFMQFYFQSHYTSWQLTK